MYAIEKSDTKINLRLPFKHGIGGIPPNFDILLWKKWFAIWLLLLTDMIIIECPTDYLFDPLQVCTNVCRHVEKCANLTARFDYPFNIWLLQYTILKKH